MLSYHFWDYPGSHAKEKKKLAINHLQTFHGIQKPDVNPIIFWIIEEIEVSLPAKTQVSIHLAIVILSNFGN